MADGAELYVHDLDRRTADASNQFPEFIKPMEPYSANAEEVISAEVKVKVSGTDHLNTELNHINQELERFTSHADKTDYALAITSGVLAGLVDSLFVGEFSLEYANQWGNQQIEKLVLRIAKYQGYGGNDLAQAVKHLEDAFPIAADKVTAAFGGGLQHHLRDFTHHPTPVGLVCSILTQFTGNVYGTDVTGAFQCVPLGEDALDLIGKSFPEKIMRGVVYWFFHMVSDVAGSSGSVRKGSLGTGLPGPLVSLLYLQAVQRNAAGGTGRKRQPDPP